MALWFQLVPNDQLFAWKQAVCLRADEQTTEFFSYAFHIFWVHQKDIIIYGAPRYLLFISSPRVQSTFAQRNIMLRLGTA